MRYLRERKLSGMLAEQPSPRRETQARSQRPTQPVLAGLLLFRECRL